MHVVIVVLGALLVIVLHPTLGQVALLLVGDDEASLLDGRLSHELDELAKRALRLYLLGLESLVQLVQLRVQPARRADDLLRLEDELRAAHYDGSVRAVGLVRCRCRGAGCIRFGLAATAARPIG